MITTPAELNEQYARFWEVENREMERRMQDPALVVVAMARIKSEMLHAMPVRNQPDLVAALAQAERDRAVFLSAFGRRGGRAKKSNALQNIIEEIVEKDPEISCGDLEKELRALQLPGGPIEDVFDGKITFSGADGRARDAPVSGLKDRLTRARKQIGMRARPHDA